MSQRAQTRLATAVVGVFVLVAVFADFIASDRPIASSQDGELTLLANVRDVGPRGAALSSQLRDGDWALWPLVRRGPVSVRHGSVIDVLAPPSSVHWLGTDDRGRDVFARLVHGARSTLVLAGSVAAGALLFGIGLALLAAAGSRAVSASVSALADVGSGVPIILLVVAVQGLWGQGGLGLAIAVLIVPRAADTARIALAGVRLALAAPYADAARAGGASRARLLLRHALPNVMPQLWVATALTATLAVLAEAALSFLGFGTPPPHPSWGELLAQAHQNNLAWWLLVPAGLCAATLAGAFGALARSPR